MRIVVISKKPRYVIKVHGLGVMSFLVCVHSFLMGWFYEKAGILRRKYRGRPARTGFPEEVYWILREARFKKNGTER